VPSGQIVDSQMTPVKVALVGWAPVGWAPTPSFHIDIASGLEYRHHLR
jgi:hypothetical protein